MRHALLAVSASFVLLHASPGEAGERKGEIQKAYELSLAGLVATTRQPRVLTIGTHVFWMGMSAAVLVAMPGDAPLWLKATSLPTSIGTLVTAPSWAGPTFALAGWKNGSLREERPGGGWARLVTQGAEYAEAVAKAGVNKVLNQVDRLRGRPPKALIDRFHLRR